MREIKFRAYVASENKMYECGGAIDYILNRFPTNDTKLVDVQNWKRGELMQYIGIEDKEGKEVYDCDIIESNVSNERGVIVYDPEKCYYNVVDIDDYNEGTRYNCAMINTAGYNWMQSDIKVIGNTKQDKELLNQG